MTELAALYQRIQDQIRAIKTWAVVLEVSVIILVLLVSAIAVTLGMTLTRISRQLDYLSRQAHERGSAEATVHYDAATVAYHRQQEALRTWYERHPPQPPENVEVYGRRYGGSASL